MQKWKSNVDPLALGELLQHTDIRIQRARSQLLWHTIFWTGSLLPNARGPLPGFPRRQVSLPSSLFFPQLQGLLKATTVFHPVILPERVSVIYLVRSTLFWFAFKAIASGHFLLPSPERTPGGPLCFTAVSLFHF